MRKRGVGLPLRKRGVGLPLRERKHINIKHVCNTQLRATVSRGGAYHLEYVLDQANQCMAAANACMARHMDGRHMDGRHMDGTSHGWTSYMTAL